MTKERGTRICAICGNEYRYCPNCAEFALYPKWMVTFDTQNCKDIYDSCSRYRMNKETKENTIKILNKLDLSARDNYKYLIKETIDELIPIVNKEEQIVQEEIKEQPKKKRKYKKKK